MDFNESKTKNNLARAFAGECQDGARYQFMAKQASSEMLESLADILKEMAKNEMAHAFIFYEHLVKNSKELKNIEISAGFPFEHYELKTSLENSAGVELSEANNIYSTFAKIARDEGFSDIAKSFEHVAAVELSHYEKFTALAEMYKHKKLFSSREACIWTCSNCGNRKKTKEAWKVCGLCGYPQGYVQIGFK